MNNNSTYIQEWTCNPLKDILSGTLVAFALIPESIGFSIAAGVSPMVGLYTSFCIAMITAIAGGRPGLISAATGSMAMVLVNIVADYGFEYMLAASILAGIFQMIFGFLKVGNLLKFIPKPVLVGFVNALGIIIFKSQLSYFKGENSLFYILLFIGLIIIWLFPRINKTIPAPLVGLVILTAFTMISGVEVTTVGDIGEITGALPTIGIPNVPLNIETFRIITPYAFSLAIVGIVESLITSNIIDERTDTDSNKNRECFGQGIANIACGLIGGMAGCGMIGQSSINISTGGRGRLSTFISGLFLFILIIILSPFVREIPICALLAVMVVVSVSTFDWGSLKKLNKVPVTDTIVMVTTVLVVSFTNNLAYGVILGVVMSSVFFAGKISKKVEVTVEETEESITYTCSGQLFFASTSELLKEFDFVNANGKKITVDMKELELWDESSVDTVDKIISRFKEKDSEVEFINISDKNMKLLSKVSENF